MSTPANIRINARVPFPALVSGAAFVTVIKQNGIWKIGVDYPELSELLNLGDLSNALVAIYDPSTGQYNTVTALQIADLAGGGGAVIPNIRKPASSSVIGLTTSDVNVGIDTRSTAVTANLPSAASWYNANKSILELTIVDYFGNAGSNNITPSLAGGDSFQYGGLTPIINQGFGVLRLRPDTTLPGWYVVGLN